MAADNNDNQPTSTFEEGKGTSMPAGEGLTTKGKTGGRRGRKCWKGTHPSGETSSAGNEMFGIGRSPKRERGQRCSCTRDDTVSQGGSIEESWIGKKTRREVKTKAARKVKELEEKVNERHRQLEIEREAKERTGEKNEQAQEAEKVRTAAKKKAQMEKERLEKWEAERNAEEAAKKSAQMEILTARLKAEQE
jgi:hypothetical protein